MLHFTCAALIFTIISFIFVNLFCLCERFSKKIIFVNSTICIGSWLFLAQWWFNAETYIEIEPATIQYVVGTNGNTYSIVQWEHNDKTYSLTSGYYGNKKVSAYRWCQKHAGLYNLGEWNVKVVD